MLIRDVLSTINCVDQFNKNVNKVDKKELIQEKLLDIQQYLLNIILEISSLIHNED